MHIVNSIFHLGGRIDLTQFVDWESASLMHGDQLGNKVLLLVTVKPASWNLTLIRLDWSLLQ